MSTIRLDTAKLDAIAAALGRNTDQALASIAFQVQAEAQVRAPVDTGALKNSLHTDKRKAGLYWVADGVDYGIWQELGSSKMRAQPFLVPATEAVSRLILTQFGGLFK